MHSSASSSTCSIAVSSYFLLSLPIIAVELGCTENKDTADAHSIPSVEPAPQPDDTCSGISVAFEYQTIPSFFTLEESLPETEPSELLDTGLEE